MSLQLRQRIFRNMAAEMNSMDRLFAMHQPFFREKRNMPEGGFDHRNSIPSNRLAELQVREENDAYVLSVELPGIPKEQVKVDLDVERGLLTITGDAKVEHESGSRDNDSGYFKSTSYTKFSRYVPVDKNKVDLNNIQAKLGDGLLRLNLPKQAAPQQPYVRSIQID